MLPCSGSKSNWGLLLLGVWLSSVCFQETFDIFVICRKYLGRWFHNLLAITMSSSPLSQVSFTDNDFQENGLVEKNVGYTFVGAMEKGNEELSSMCISFMKKHLNRSNCFQRLNIANEYDCEELAQSANRYIVKRLGDLTTKSEFLKLTPNQATRIVKLEKRRVSSAGRSTGALNPALLPGIIRWAKYAPKQREKYLYLFFKNLKLDSMDAGLLKRIFWDDEFVHGNRDCRNLYLEIIHNKFFSSHFQARHDDNNNSTAGSLRFSEVSIEEEAGECLHSNQSSLSAGSLPT